ncbi:MAG: SDR family oxidoreductase [Desulfatitalea sp.]|nr:SDR family oxidoreductase [Desulfatitalea sp.]NNJ98936.1 SDR family oxidoreductase [Desulfatitalea sp.]
MRRGKRLKERTALITGGNGGIGLGIAEAFALEGAGVMIAGTNLQKLDRAKATLVPHGQRVEIAQVDVSDRGACFDLVSRTIEIFGQLDILVNGAAIYIPRAFTDYTPEEFSRTLEVNLHGPFHLMQAVMPHMIERGYGKIINIASTAGKWASKNQCAYNVAKHGMVGMTRCAALEHAGQGISINAICPGLVQTDLVDQFEKEHAALNNTTPDVIRTELIKRVPMGHYLNVADCGHLAVYLASSESNAMTGQSILLDGGMLFI